METGRDAVIGGASKEGAADWLQPLFNSEDPRESLQSITLPAIFTEMA